MSTLVHIPGLGPVGLASHASAGSKPSSWMCSVPELREASLFELYKTDGSILHFVEIGIRTSKDG
jgi:hypothetical protein